MLLRLPPVIWLFVFLPLGVAQDRQAQLNKQYNDLLAAHRPAVAAASKATVNVVVDGRQLVLGTVVHPSGWVLTKTSELGENPDATELRILAGERLMAATLHRIFAEDDLALLEVDVERPLDAISFEVGEAPVPGTFVAAAGPSRKTPLAIGVLSVSPRNIPIERAFLGVALDTEAAGKVRIDEVIEGTAAAAAGIEDGDEVLRMNGKTYANAGEFIEAVGQLEPGDTVNLVIKRAGETIDFTVQLRKRSSLPAERQNRFDRMNRMGGALSGRANGFESAFQTDLPVSPEECGGPVCGLDGEALGICVARAGRIKTYVVPAARVAELLKSTSMGEGAAIAADVTDATDTIAGSPEATRSQLERSLREVRSAIKALQAAEKKLSSSLERVE